MTAMVGESLFLDVAKIAITCVGFASVVAALRHPKNEKWRYAEIMGLRTMIEFSFAAVIGGLLPSAVYL